MRDKVGKKEKMYVDLPWVPKARELSSNSSLAMENVMKSSGRRQRKG